MEIINQSNLHKYMLFAGGMFGETSILTNEYLTNYTVKALEDCFFFIISKSSILKFFKKIIYNEYDSISQANSILFSKKTKFIKI